MIFQAWDCLSDTVLSERSTKEEADLECQRYGGNDKCYYVFEKKTDDEGQFVLF